MEDKRKVAMGVRSDRVYTLDKRQQVKGIYFKSINEKLYFHNMDSDSAPKNKLVSILNQLADYYSETDKELNDHYNYSLEYLTTFRGYKVLLDDSICIKDMYFIYDNDTLSESIEDLVLLNKMITTDRSHIKAFCNWKHDSIKIDIAVRERQMVRKNTDRDYVTIIIRLDNAIY